MASTTHFLPAPIDKPIDDAKRQFAELWAFPSVTAHYLMIAVVCLGCVSVGALILNFRTNALLRTFRPIVIRIDDVGRAQATSYDSLQYQPQQKEMKYFLEQFVHSYYSRNRRTASKDFAHSLLFLDSSLAGGRMDQNRKTREIEQFIVNANEEIEVEVKQIVLPDLRAQPFKAEIDFDKVYLTGTERSEARREKYVANLIFGFAEQVPEGMMHVNPLGLTISYFRADFVGEVPKP